MHTNVRSYTDDQIINRVEQLISFQGWQQGKYDIWVRSNEDEFDRFDDKVYSFEVMNTGEKPVFGMVCSGTSHAGAAGLMKYDTKYDNTRCAILASDVIIYNSHYYGKHKNQYYAYRQGKAFPYFEDTNKDKKIDETGKLVLNKVIYANNHRAGQASTQIGGWSIACLVRNIRKQYDKWMKWMDKTENLTVCILREWNPAANVPPVDPLTRNL